MWQWDTFTTYVISHHFLLENKKNKKRRKKNTRDARTTTSKSHPSCHRHRPKYGAYFVVYGAFASFYDDYDELKTRKTRNSFCSNDHFTARTDPLPRYLWRYDVLHVNFYLRRRKASKKKTVFGTEAEGLGERVRMRGIVVNWGSNTHFSIRILVHGFKPSNILVLTACRCMHRTHT